MGYVWNPVEMDKLNKLRVFLLVSIQSVVSAQGHLLLLQMCLSMLLLPLLLTPAHLQGHLLTLPQGHLPMLPQGHLLMLLQGHLPMLLQEHLLMLPQEHLLMLPQEHLPMLALLMQGHLPMLPQEHLPSLLTQGHLSRVLRSQTL